MGINLETLLHTELADGFDALAKVDKGSESYIKLVDGQTKLLDKAIELDKLNIEHEKEMESRKFENDLKLAQFKEERMDRWVKNILTGLGIAIPAGCTIWGVITSLKFEENGTVTTMAGRGLFQKLLPKK